MKSVNFPQGFKEAMSLRGIDMGKPMMNYPSEALAKIVDLKERLKIEMASLLYEYFPGMPLNYRTGEDITNKYSYPGACENAGEKKFDDCTQCGMCDGTTENNPEKDGSSNNNVSAKSSTGLSREEIESIVNETVKKIKNGM